MNNICIIKQPAGIGDIFFTQKIARNYIDLGYTIVWPVYDELLWISNYIKDIHFVSINADFGLNDIYSQFTGKYESYDLIMLDLLNADKTHYDGKIMSSKYNLAGLSYHGWQDYFNFDRNIYKEEELFNMLGLQVGTEYTLVNNLYGTPPNQKVFNIPQLTNNAIRLSIIEGFTLLDWCKVIEYATEIITINTSINYIIDKIATHARLISVYSHSNSNMHEINYLFNHPNIVYI